MKSVIAALVCVGLFWVCVSSPQRENAKAQEEVAVKAARIEQAEVTLSQIAEALAGQNAINTRLADADAKSIETIANMQEAIAQLASQVNQSPTREEITKLVATNVSSLADECDCTCGEKLAEMQKQIDELKTRLAALEAKPTYSTSSYGSSSGGPVVSSGGSTGSVKTASGGSTGSVVYSQPVTSAVTSTASTYRPRWQNHDGLSRAEHAAVYHGLNTAGMTQDQINRVLDADHDQYGAQHGSILASRTRSVTRAVQSTSNCPGGVCPPRGTSSRGGGLLGLGVFGRR